MYLKFSVPAPGKRETGQLYVGLSVETVTAGFRIYLGGKRKESALALIAEPRINADSGWVAKQKKRLSRRYESYWYTTVKGEWTKHSGWPAAPENWKKILAWIVRRKFTPSAATRASFRAKPPRSFATFTRSFVSLRCRRLKYSFSECIFLLHLRQHEEESAGKRAVAWIPKRLTLRALSNTMPPVASLCFCMHEKEICCQ